MIFKDRREAGRILAERLKALRDENPVILALPRGGVPVAYEVARGLSAPLDLVLARKIGAPDQPEFAIGAIADGPVPELVLDQRLIQALEVTGEYLDHAKTQALAEIERRRAVYLKDRKPKDIQGCLVILVDDGIATGATMLAAIRAVRQRGPARLVMAVPVAAQATIKRLGPEVNEIVCLQMPKALRAVGYFYRDFSQLEDQEVIDLLAANRAEVSRPR